MSPRGAGSDPHRREVDEELRHHLALRVEALVRRGHTAEEARRRVAREAGDLETAARYCARMAAARERASRRRALWSGWSAEARASLRSLLRRPGGPAGAAAVLAVAIMLNTVVFSLVQGVLLEPLPFPDADRTVALRERPVRAGGSPTGVSLPALARWREGGRALEATVGHLPTSLAFAGADGPIYLDGAAVTEGFLSFTGARPLVGRALEAADHRPDAERAVVLSEGLWRGAFGADPGVVGDLLELEGEAHRVVGVLGGTPWPEGAAYWVALERRSPELADVWGARIVSALGRLAPGARAAEAEAEMARLAADIPDAGRWLPLVTPLDDHLRRGVRRPLAMLQGAVALVLLIACANLGILLLARGQRRRGDAAVRRAMGAGSGRLAVHAATEALAVAGGACALGLGLAAPVLDAVLAHVPYALPGAGAVRLDGTVVLFALGMALATGALAGLVPAAQALRTPAGASLRTSAGAAGGPVARRVRSCLVVAQVTMSVVLLGSAGLLARSFLAAVDQDPGFRARGVLTAELSLPPARYGGQADVVAFVDALLPRLEALPGVEAAAVARNLPVTGSSMTSPVAIGEGEPTPEPAQIAWVSPGYFAVMGTAVTAGRAFSGEDRDGGRPVAMVDRTFARRFLDGRPPVGLRARSYFGGQEPREIVGVAGAVRHDGLMKAPPPVFYEPFLQAPAGGFFVLVRSPEPAAALSARVRGVLAELDPTLPLRSVATLEQRVGRTVAAPRFYATLLGGFAALSLALTVLGCHSVLAHLVGERRREIGIRMALGARARSVRALVVRQALALTGAGLALGLVAALPATRALEGLLFEVAPTDPLVLLAVPLVMGCAALAAAWLPARRATTVDPARTLQEG